MGTAEAHDERSTVFPNGLEVRDARIPAVCEEQAALQRRRIRQELSFGLLVGRDLDRTHLVGEATVRGVNLDRCGSIVVNRAGNTSRSLFLRANEEPSWIIERNRRCGVMVRSRSLCPVRRPSSLTSSVDSARARSLHPDQLSNRQRGLLVV